MKVKYFYMLLVVFAVSAVMLAACGGTAATPAPTPTSEEEHVEGEEIDEHAPEEHVEGAEGAHSVPEEASELENPFEASEESISTGATIYANNCAVCHGEEGEGDGPGAQGLDPQPSDLHDEHVQELTDGGLFYIISHGRPETAMPAWEGTISEEERWHVVNFLRTFE